MKIRKEVKKLEDQIINWRRYFHQNPELGFKEFNTAEKIFNELKKMGLNPKKNVGKTGVIADLIFGW